MIVGVCSLLAYMCQVVAYGLVGATLNPYPGVHQTSSRSSCRPDIDFTFAGYAPRNEAVLALLPPDAVTKVTPPVIIHFEQLTCGDRADPLDHYGLDRATR